MSATPTASPLQALPGEAGVDPRGPRFGAGITAVLLLIVIGHGLATASVPPVALRDRLGEPAFLLFAAIAVLFAWGAIAGVQRHPWGVIFRTLIRPRLVASDHLESPAPPRFAQGVGLLVAVVGVVLHLAGVPFGLVGAASAAFIAAFLNAVFDYCLGCQLYLLLARLRSR